MPAVVEDESTSMTELSGPSATDNNKELPVIQMKEAEKSPSMAVAELRKVMSSNVREALLRKELNDLQQQQAAIEEASLCTEDSTMVPTEVSFPCHPSSDEYLDDITLESGDVFTTPLFVHKRSKSAAKFRRDASMFTEDSTMAETLGSLREVVDHPPCVNRDKQMRFGAAEADPIELADIDGGIVAQVTPTSMMQPTEYQSTRWFACW